MIGAHPVSPPSPWAAALRMRCPRCGEGRLFDGYLKIVDRCSHCGLPLAKNDSGDGPAVFLIFIIGTIATPFAFLFHYWFADLPYWVLILAVSALVLGMVLVTLRPSKALVVALQYRHRREDYEDD